jgi:hypothetical protein
MKVVYIAHPISGDVMGNIALILEIIRGINLNEPGILPLAPYIGDVLAMDDDTPEERAKGLKNGLELLKRGMFDELRLYGNTISAGVYGEIIEAKKHGMTVIPMTTETQDEYYNLFECQSPSCIELLTQWHDE